MDLVRDVQEEFRKASCLKFLYQGKSTAGEGIEIPLLLPPSAENTKVAVDDEYIRKHNMSLLKIEMSDQTETNGQQQVYDFVKGQVAVNNSNYVVSVRFNTENTYQNYLGSIYAMQLGFYQVYHDKAQAMFGKNFKEIFNNRTTDEDFKKMYDAVRKDVPMALSIAELK